jgi:hypothetical protein
MEVKKQQTDHKLEVVTVRYTSDGIMKEKIITITILQGYKNYSKRKSHHIQTQLSSGR